MPHPNHAITHVAVDGTAEENAVHVKMSVVVEIIPEGFHFVQLLPHCVAITDVRVKHAEKGDDAGAHIIPRRAHHTLLVNQPGRYTVDMSFTTRYTGTVKQGVDIPCLESCSTVLNFNVPNQSVTLTVSPQLSHSQEEGKITARVAPTSTITVTWTCIETQPIPTPMSMLGREDTEESVENKSVSEKEVKVKEMVITSSQDVLHTIGGGVCHTRVEQAYNISNGNKSEFSLRLERSGSAERDAPKAWAAQVRTRATRILNVEGPNVRSWEYSDEDALLVVSLDTPAEGLCTFTITAETELIGTTCRILPPSFTPDGVNRGRGAIGISAHSSVELLEGEAMNMSKVDASELPPSLTACGSILIAYKYLTANHRLTVTSIKHDDVAVITCLCESATYKITQNGQQLLYDLSFNLKNTQTQYLKLTLPTKGDVWSANVAGQVVKPSADHAGRTLLPLPKGSNVAFTASFVYVAKAPGLPDVRGDIRNIGYSFPQIDLPITHLRAEICLPSSHLFAQFAGGVEEVEAYCNSAVLREVHDANMYQSAPMSKAVLPRRAKVAKRARGPQLERMSSITMQPPLRMQQPPPMQQRGIARHDMAYMTQNVVTDMAEDQLSVCSGSYGSDSESSSEEGNDFGMDRWDGDGDAVATGAAMVGGIKPLTVDTRSFLFEKLLVPADTVLSVSADCCMAKQKKQRTVASDAKNSGTTRCEVQ